MKQEQQQQLQQQHGVRGAPISEPILNTMQQGPPPMEYYDSNSNPTMDSNEEMKQAYGGHQQPQQDVRSPNHGGGSGGSYNPYHPHYPSSHMHPPPPPHSYGMLPHNQHHYIQHHYPPPHYMHHYPPPHYMHPSQHQSPVNNASSQQQATVRPSSRNKVEHKENKSPDKEPSKEIKAASPLSSDGDAEKLITNNVSFHNEQQQQELITISVPPMRSDFSFFVEEQKEALIQSTKEELPIIFQKLNLPVPSNESEYDATLLFSHVNERLISLWENTPQSARQPYVIKEEADRKRFMNAEEVASQHCATLTARGKSPAFSLEKQQMNVSQQPPQESHKYLKSRSSSQLEEDSHGDMSLHPISPTKKNRVEFTLSKPEDKESKNVTNNKQDLKPISEGTVISNDLSQQCNDSTARIQQEDIDSNPLHIAPSIPQVKQEPSQLQESDQCNVVNETNQEHNLNNQEESKETLNSVDEDEIQKMEI